MLNNYFNVKLLFVFIIFIKNFAERNLIMNIIKKIFNLIFNLI